MTLHLSGTTELHPQPLVKDFEGIVFLVYIISLCSFPFYSFHSKVLHWILFNCKKLRSRRGETPSSLFCSYCNKIWQKARGKILKKSPSISLLPIHFNFYDRFSTLSIIKNDRDHNSYTNIHIFQFIVRLDALHDRQTSVTNMTLKIM